MRSLGRNIDSKQQVLESVAIKGHLQGLCLSYEVTQAYVNTHEHNIEAVYTFPLPQGAVLLDLKVQLGDKLLSGKVMSKAQAEDGYEEAISEGNNAIMLERTEGGIYTVNVGNLLAGERAALRYRYSQLLNWQQDSLKITLPTTIAPRYGDATIAGWQPHQVISHHVNVVYPFNFTLDIDSPLANALIESPSHQVAVTRRDGNVQVTLSGGQAWLDHDLVLNLTLQAGNKNTGTIEFDHAGFVALASFSPDISGEELASACIKVVVDCSGSMAGESIGQAKMGLLRILDNLRETDTFNIVRFGTTARAYFPECVPAKGRALRMARQSVETMQADLGGTEMGMAFEFAYQLKDKGDRPVSVVLITDGEIYGHEAIVKSAEASAHRVFSIGVGNAVAESFIRSIAHKTGGASELVSPKEGMAATIYRQFRRILQPKAVAATVRWPSQPLWQSPENISTVYKGDTLHVYAGFSQRPEGEAILQLTLDNGQKVEQTITLQSNPSAKIELARMAAAKRIESLTDAGNEDQATLLAEEYQLISRYSNYLIVEARDEALRPVNAPVFTKVDHMLPMPGFRGAVNASYSVPIFCRKDPSGHPATAALSCPMKIGTVYKSMLEASQPAPQSMDRLMHLVRTARDWYKTFNHTILDRLPDALADTLERLVKDEGWTDRVVKAALFLAMLNQCGGIISVSEKQNITAKLTAECADEFMIKFFEDSLTLDEDGWQWTSVYELLPVSG